jgi:hypothetical protein
MRSVLVAGLLACVACVDQGPGPQLKKIDPRYVADHLLAELPPGVEKLDIALGERSESSERGAPAGSAGGTGGKAPGGISGKVVYVGNTVDRPAVGPGQAVRITHYWRVVEPVGPGWRVFALVRGAAGTSDFMNLPATDMQIGHGPATWKAGELIEDVQQFTLRPDWRSSTATIQVGLIATGGHGVGDRMAASGPRTQDRAVIARVIEVDLSRAPAPPGTVHVPRAAAPITIDGVAAEPAWAAVAWSPDLITAEGSADPVGKATAKLTWDDQYLYVFATVTDSDVVTAYKNHDDPLWKQDCVELFIDADGNRRGYVELQVNPNNATFDSWFATTRAQPGDTTWDSGMITAVKLRGTTEPGDTDKGWDVEIAIPWQAVRGRDEAMAVRLPPQIGERWRLNLVRVDVKTGEKNPQASSWNRITSADFHALDRMLTAVFANPSGSIVPPATPPPAPAAPAAAPVTPATESATPPTPPSGVPGPGSAAPTPRVPARSSAPAAASPGAGAAAPAPGAQAPAAPARGSGAAR